MRIPLLGPLCRWRGEQPRKDDGCPLYKRYIKRLIDIGISLCVLVILSPVFLFTAIAIKCESPGPVIFKQKRLGLGGKEFYIYKFRSMVQNAEHTGSGVYSGKGDARVTRVGKVIRATSIDELPQAVNMLKGDRGIIGTTKKNIDFSSVVTA